MGWKEGSQGGTVARGYGYRSQQLDPCWPYAVPHTLQAANPHMLQPEGSLPSSRRVVSYRSPL